MLAVLHYGVHVQFFFTILLLHDDDDVERLRSNLLTFVCLIFSPLCKQDFSVKINFVFSPSSFCLMMKLKTLKNCVNSVVVDVKVWSVFSKAFFSPLVI